jgi:hypothetical protein
VDELSGLASNHLTDTMISTAQLFLLDLRIDSFPCKGHSDCWHLSTQRDPNWAHEGTYC